MRAVFDTNVVVSALVFAAGRVAWLRDVWQAGQVVPVVGRDTVRELVRVLEYPKLALSEEDREELLAEYLPYTETVMGPVPVCQGTRCRDPDDQKFIDPALAAGVDALVSGDPDLTDLAGVFAVTVLTPAQLRKKLRLVV
jgi:putative PIN family toxin of toxin-antitoxin system